MTEVYVEPSLPCVCIVIWSVLPLRVVLVGRGDGARPGDVHAPRHAVVSIEGGSGVASIAVAGLDRVAGRVVAVRRLVLVRRAQDGRAVGLRRHEVVGEVVGVHRGRAGGLVGLVTVVVSLSNG